MPSTALVTVVSGAAYVAYAEAMFESAREHFHPTEEVLFVTLPGRKGWPDATMYRPRILAEQMPDADYVFLIDADMVFVAPVGSEVLPGIGVTATQHPGYVGKSDSELPYEYRATSACYVASGEGAAYYAGGFFGGGHSAMGFLVGAIAVLIDIDLAKGITPVWHDESALNACLALAPPTRVLSPSYCYPNNDHWYRTFWLESYERRIVAVDKTQAERGDR